MNSDDGSFSRTAFTIRPYSPADSETTIEIFLRAIREVASKDYNPAQVDAWATVEDRRAWAARRSTKPTWIVGNKAGPVGFADLESDGNVDMMFVCPDHQGVGAASLLLATVEAAAREKGLARLSTEASLTARPFFERRGFVVLAHQSVEKRGQVLQNFRMEKFLR